jgi:hemerythrin-like domain-containing protein
MNIIDALLGEHAVLYAEIEHLEAALPDEESVADVHAGVACFAALVLSHSSLEDELLFVGLERRLGAGHGVVQSMRRMHTDLDAAFERLRRTTDLGEARELASSAVALAREHFAAEEETCFTLAEDALSREQLEQIGRVWVDRRGISGI